MVLALILTATPAYAATISEKKAQAASVQAQVEALDTKAEVAIEDYNQASVRYSKLSKQVRTNARKLSRLRAQMTKVQGHLYTRAEDMYRSGQLGFLSVLLEAKSFDEFNKTWDLLKDMNSNDASAVRDLKSIKKDAEQTQKVLTNAQTLAAKQKKAMATKKKDVLGRLSDRKALLRTINSDIKAMIAAQQAEEAASARRAWSASNRSSGRHWIDVGGNPPSNASRGEKVVYWAKTRLGCPYVWAADGPSSFDCSGLTMWSYAKVGVSLPHSSRDQIHYGSRVSRANLEPGDLVFFGRSSIHHVGIYVGGGMYIHAPHSGDVVKISSLDSRSDYAGACRP